jgi:hypothetical protein
VALLAWGYAFVFWNPDFDEIHHAHVIWLIGHGLVPFHDFFECHLPLPWYFHVPLLWVLPETPESIYGLRAFSTTGHLLWLGLLLATLRHVRPELPGHWLVLAIPALLASDLNLEYATEFRLDGWAYVPLFAAIYLFETRVRWTRLRRHAVLGIGCTLAVLSMPKLYPLPPLYALAVLLRDRRDGLALTPAVAATALGIAVGFLGVVVTLRLAGIDPRLAFESSILFHLEFMRGSSFGRGAATAFLQQRVPLTFAVCGALCLVVEHARRRRMPQPLEIALLGTVAFQLATMRIGYKQYAVPCFLLLAGAIPYIGLLVRELRPRLEPAACALAVALVLLGSAGAVRQIRSESDFPALLVAQQRLLALSSEDDVVAVPPPFHPIYRRDALYAWTNSWEPGGYTTDRVLAAMAHPVLSPPHTAERIAADLEARPPAIAMLTGPPFQNATFARELSRFLERHRSEYARLDATFYPTFVSIENLERAGAPR